MDPDHSITTITTTTFQTLLASYPSTLPPKLTDLDTARYESLPALLAERKSSINDPYLTLSKLTTLMDWKLSHGTFRPSLKALIAQNSDAFVRETTAAGFALFPADLKASLKELTKLRGVGPATASLCLAVCFPEEVPFFSDELFRWCLWEDGSGRGWDRGIKYSAKEYLEVCVAVGELRRRLGEDVRAVDVEKVAYVLGKRVLGGATGEMEAADQKVAVGAKKRTAPPERPLNDSDGGGSKDSSKTQLERPPTKRRKKAADAPGDISARTTRFSARAKSKQNPD